MNASNVRVTRKWWAAPAAFLATVLALPVNAGITIPDDPLTTGARVAPNVLFILDDSGSMSFDEMYNPSVSRTSGDGTVRNLSYATNTVYYNPAITYDTWTNAAGTRLTGGTTYGAAYADFDRAAGGTINLADSSSCSTHTQNGGNVSVCGGVQTYFVPKISTNTTATYLSDAVNYYRYQILSDGSVYRAERLGYTTANTTTSATLGVNVGSVLPGLYSTTWSFQVPDGAGNLVIRITGGTATGRGADLYVRRGNSTVTIGNYDWSSTTNGNAETVTLASPAAGTYYVRIYAQAAYVGPVTASYSYEGGYGCASSTSGTSWRNCTRVTPSYVDSQGVTRQRDEAGERNNYATWFSYHRTRMKAAKAGASEAFKPLDSKVRVGFRTIWNRNTFNIPVTDGNDGRFVDNPDDPRTPANESTTSRSTWYQRLHNATSGGNTPLHGALNSAGAYFGNSDPTGPYGPQSSPNQYSCRQNFAILTTDGYWNNYQGVDVGNQDNAGGTNITGPNNQSYTYTANSPYRDGYSNTLADVAMYYWKRDLRTDASMVNNVPTTAKNPAFWQHMVTFGISIGLKGNKGWTSVEEVPNNATWADATVDENADRIDDLLHAAVNSRGAFVSASDPAEFTAGLGLALAAIAERTSSYSNVSSNSVSLDTGSQVFSASYVSGAWTGQVTARSVSSSGVGGIAWTSSIPNWSTRKVFTFNGLTGASFPTTLQSASLLRIGGTADYPVLANDNANYIKGETRLEERNNTGKLRNRNSVLGDIVSSSPAYVADTNTLYVGANDGMLHAFDAASGAELFAYVPNILNFGHLSTLSRGDYTHKFFVDGPIAVTSRALTPGRNLLVGTLGRGGKGVYSLDVTAPAAASATSIAKWERAETPGNNMGLVLGRPVLANMVGGTSVAVIGNGINSTRERAVLVVLNAETGAVIREIDTGVGSTALPNGLSAPTAAYDADGKTLKYIFAGDMQGNVWKFDLTNAVPANWTATRLFSAVDGTGKAQPITARVTIATHPLTRKRWVFFGTGRYMTVDDASSTSTDVQSMYGFVDESTTVARSDLTQRTITVTSDTVSGFPVRAFQARANLPTGSKGWYINLPASGERIVQDAQVVSAFLITASMIPTGNACEADGSGYINALSAFTGTSGGTAFFDLNGNGQTSDDSVTSGANQLPVGSVNLGVGMPTLPNLLRGLTVVDGTGGTGGRGLRGLGANWERVSWREVRRD
jgi:type IV pilus assembly protein PilY1